MLPPQTLNALCTAYAIGTPLACERVMPQAASERFMLRTSEGCYVLLCVHERRSLRSLGYEQQLIAYLRQQGFPAPAIRPTRYGLGLALHDNRLYMLMDAQAGNAYDATQPVHLGAAGQGLGLFHRLCANYALPTPETGHHGLERPHSLAARRAAGTWQALAREGLLTLEDEARRLSRSVAMSDARALPGTLIHGSYHPEALLLRGADLVLVQHYGRAQHAVRIQELADALWSFCAGAQAGWDSERASTFLSAYRTECVLSAAELALLPLALRVRCLNSMIERCDTLVAQGGATTDLAATLEAALRQLTLLERHAHELSDLRANTMAA